MLCQNQKTEFLNTKKQRLQERFKNKILIKTRVSLFDEGWYSVSKKEIWFILADVAEASLDNIKDLSFFRVFFFMYHGVLKIINKEPVKYFKID